MRGGASAAGLIRAHGGGGMRRRWGDSLRTAAPARVDIYLHYTYVRQRLHTVRLPAGEIGNVCDAADMSE